MDAPRIPVALIDRARSHLNELAKATTADEQLRALFLCHCELRDAVEMIQAVPATDSTDEN